MKAGVEEVRDGAALVKATFPYAQEDVATTWRLLFTTFVVLFISFGAALFAPWLPLRLVAAVVAGLTWVRAFIFFHDALHGAVFRDSWLGMRVMDVIGWYTLSPASVWKETHDYHHRNNAKLVGASIGSYPLVSTKMWPKMTVAQRRWYAFARHPLTIAAGYMTIFVAGMCISAFLREPKKHWQAGVALVVHFGTGAALWAAFGASTALIGYFLPMAVSFSSGAYLFYAQHNFPTIDLRGRREWSYHYAALRSSSYFVMPRLMHWFTGNIGYHHVHHLNHKIPFYRLPEAMAAIPELQNPGETSWRPSDIMACLRLKMWDPEAGKMVGWNGQ
jgi:omega-6 fatty acid desaturase (delta-12 desaturase)